LPLNLCNKSQKNNRNIERRLQMLFAATMTGVMYIAVHIIVGLI